MWIARKLKDFKSKAQFWKETAIIEFTEQVVSAMTARKLKRSDLAKTMGKSKAHVTQLLQGPNMTFGTASELALSVGMRFHPVLEELEQAIIVAGEQRGPDYAAWGESLSQAMLDVCASRSSERSLRSGPYEFVWPLEGSARLGLDTLVTR
jgi:hypothetical protein